MKIIILNKLKEYFDNRKIAVMLGTLPETQQEPIHDTTQKLLSSCILDNNQEQLKKILSDLSLLNWNWVVYNYFSQPLFHIVYYTTKEKYHSKGINVYAIDMMSACEQFASEFGIDPYYCTVKEKE